MTKSIPLTGKAAEDMKKLFDQERERIKASKYDEALKTQLLDGCDIDEQRALRGDILFY